MKSQTVCAIRSLFTETVQILLNILMVIWFCILRQVPEAILEHLPGSTDLTGHPVVVLSRYVSTILFSISLCLF